MRTHKLEVDPESGVTVQLGTEWMRKLQPGDRFMIHGEEFRLISNRPGL